MLGQGTALQAFTALLLLLPLLLPSQRMLQHRPRPCADCWRQLPCAPSQRPVLHRGIRKRWARGVPGTQRSLAS